ncbi:MAG: tRNA (guanine(26)-N(2))-dimethyltransferase [Haloglomus sp.]
MNVSEGTITVEVPEQPEQGTGDAVFFNPEQELNRDLTVAVLRAYRERAEEVGVDGPPPRSYLDATAASGIRGVRAANEGFEATCCDVDPEAVELARENFARNGLDGAAVHRDANALLHEKRFDVVDLDPFGTPIPFADAAFQSARTLLCVTATDTAPLCGAHFASGVRSYSAIPRNTDFHAEMGLRILLSALVRTAARYDVAAEPVLSHSAPHYARTYLELTSGARAADALLEELGHVDWCPDCFWRTARRGLVHDPVAECPNCERSTKPAGPLWLGPVRERDFLARVRENVTEEMGAADAAEQTLDRLDTELDEPTHYDQHRLFANWSAPAIGMDEFVEQLRGAGFDASRAHYGGTTFKTTADVVEMTELFA